MAVGVLLVWLVSGVGIGIWRWTSLGRMRSSIDAHERGLKELDAVVRRTQTRPERRARNPMPGGHVKMLPSETAVLRPPRRKKRARRSAGNGNGLGISA